MAHFPTGNMTREFLLSIPAKLRQEEVVREAETIRRVVYNHACAGKTKYNHPIQNIRTVNGRQVKSSGQPFANIDDMVAELSRTLEGCRVEHVTALTGDHGYNRPESIEIDWS